MPDETISLRDIARVYTPTEPDAAPAPSPQTISLRDIARVYDPSAQGHSAPSSWLPQIGGPMPPAPTPPWTPADQEDEAPARGQGGLPLRGRGPTPAQLAAPPAVAAPRSRGPYDIPNPRQFEAEP